MFLLPGPCGQQVSSRWLSQARCRSLGGLAAGTFVRRCIYFAQEFCPGFVRTVTCSVTAPGGEPHSIYMTLTVLEEPYVRWRLPFLFLLLGLSLLFSLQRAGRSAAEWRPGRPRPRCSLSFLTAPYAFDCWSLLLALGPVGKSLGFARMWGWGWAGRKAALPFARGTLTSGWQHGHFFHIFCVFRPHPCHRLCGFVLGAAFHPSVRYHPTPAPG